MQSQIQGVVYEYPNLEFLTIVSQNDLQYLDIRNLNKLQDLSIILNKNLKTINGLKYCKDLYSLTFYDNQTFLQQFIR